MSCVDWVAIRRLASLASLAVAPAFASAGAARATTWHDGDPVTYDQTTWATDGSDANRLLLDEFPTV